MLTREQVTKLKKEVSETIDVMSDNKKMETNFNVGINYEGLYSNATEDMAGYYPEFGTPKTFLTVGASGDQTLNAVLQGAKEIKAFDLNYLAKRGVALKVAAVRALTLQELNTFYSTFNEELYVKVSQYLDEENCTYWDALYNYFDGIDIARRLYIYKRLNSELITSINPYLEKEKYQLLQSKLSDVDIKYYDSDLYNLPKHLENQTFDAINFSNIYEYLNYGKNCSRELAEKYHNFIMKDIYPKLNENGCMMFAYLYAFNDNVKQHVDKLYEANPEKLVPSGNVNLEQMESFLEGLTSQNMSYSFLLDAFANDQINKILTTNVFYGHSIDHSHDLALCLKKQ